MEGGKILAQMFVLEGSEEEREAFMACMRHSNTFRSHHAVPGFIVVIISDDDGIQLTL
jgi:hypothetical protein